MGPLCIVWPIEQSLSPAQHKDEHILANEDNATQVDSLHYDYLMRVESRARLERVK